MAPCCRNFFLLNVLNPCDDIVHTVFPHVRPAGIIFSLGPQLWVLLEIAKFHLHKRVPGAGIIRNAGIIRGRALYEEISREF